MGKRVLVVDDDVKTVELVKLYLNRDGYGVYVAYDGIEALRVARENKPDLVVLDLMLPGCDGLEVCRTLKHESGVPVIVLTGRATYEDQVEVFERGADDYVTKPFSPRDLVSRVAMLLKSLADEALAHEAQEVETGHSG
jgi:two-component system, OmpR family, alkaline phosphatase synthesis response regulator PhoP